MALNIVQSIKATSAYKDFETNKRLQILMLLVCALVMVYVITEVNNVVAEKEIMLNQEISLHKRLVAAKNTPFDQDLLDQQQQIAKLNLDVLPVASSQSAAQASALASLESAIGGVTQRSRFNLLGSELIELGNVNLWSVRIEVNGQLAEEKIVTFLKEFDVEKAHRRIASMQYAPIANNSLTVVVDVLYRENQTK